MYLNLDHPCGAANKEINKITVVKRINVNNKGNLKSIKNYLILNFLK